MWTEGSQKPHFFVDKWMAPTSEETRSSANHWSVVMLKWEQLLGGAFHSKPTLKHALAVSTQHARPSKYHTV